MTQDTQQQETNLIENNERNGIFESIDYEQDLCEVDSSDGFLDLH